MIDLPQIFRCLSELDPSWLWLLFVGCIAFVVFVFLLGVHIGQHVWTWLDGEEQGNRNTPRD